MNTKVLVTGAEGQLGKTLVELFSDNDSNIEFTFVSKTQLDITNTENLKVFFQSNEFNYCVNCAAYTQVDQAEEDEEKAFSINAYSVKNLAIICKSQQVTLIHISTDYVFNGASEKPYLEDDKTAPLNIYGTSKLKGENFIKEYMDNFFIIRTSWLYSNYGKNFYKTIINKIDNDEFLKILDTEKGTPTSCIELSKFICYLIVNNNTSYGLYHFSNSGETTWFAYAKEIAGYFKSYKLENITPVKVFKTKAERPSYSVLSKQKIMKQFNLSIPSWEESLKEMIKNLRAKQL